MINAKKKQSQAVKEESQRLGRAGVACSTVAREGFTEKRTCSENERKRGAREPESQRILWGKAFSFQAQGTASASGEWAWHV